MRWENDSEQLHGTSDPNKIVEALLLCGEEGKLSGPKYRVLSQRNDMAIISNVPTLIYERENLKKYISPLKIKRNLKFIEFLQSNIDKLQHSEISDPIALGNGETFRVNQCYDNSTRLFHFVKYLRRTSVIPKKYKIQIVIGYITSKIPFGTNIGNIVVENDSLVLHDWHTWNLINNLLVDLSLFQNGNLISFNSKMPSWGDARDHVFIKPPTGIEYFGSAYNDLDRFNNNIQLYF